MNSRKKNLLIWSGIGIFIIAIAIFFLVFNGGKGHYVPVIYALPQDAIFFYKGDDFVKSFEKLSDSELWKGIRSDSAINKVEKQIHQYDSVIGRSNKMKSLLKHGEIIISIHKTSLRKLDVLSLIQTKKKIKADDFLALIPQHIRSRQIKTTFEGYDIYDFQEAANKSHLSFCLFEGILAVSKNPVLVEDAVRTYLKNKLINQSSFAVLDSRKDGEWNINFKMLASFLGIFMSQDKISSLEGMASFNGIGNYNTEVQKDFLAFRGEFLDADTGKSYISQFYDQQPGKTELPMILPSRTSLLFSYYISDLNAFYKNFKERIQSEGFNTDYEVSVKRFERIYKTNIETDVLPFLSDQYGIAVTQSPDKSLNKSISIIVKVKNNETASGFFSVPGAIIPISDSTGNENAGVYNDYRIYKNKYNGLFPLIFGKMFDLPNESYFINIRNFLIFSADIKILKNYIDDQVSGKTLASSPEFLRMSGNITSEANLFFYLNTTRALDIPSLYLDDSIKIRFEKAIPLVRKVSSFAFQVTNNNNSFYSEIVFNYSGSDISGKEILWQTELDTTMILKPFVVKNHTNDALELIVFDGRNNMYLISDNGTILFKRKLNAMPIGDIYQIDFFDNKKLQYLFCTQNHLQMVDRLGRDVANYPIRLAASAASGLAVLDPGNDADIKYFVSCNNGNIYGYNLPGKPLAGWNPRNIDATLPFPISFFNLNSKSYLYALSSKGVCYLWDSKTEILKPVNTSSGFTNPPYFISGNDLKSSRIVLADTNSSTFFIALDGKNNILSSLGNNSPEVFFDVRDVLPDKGFELIFSVGNTITFYDMSGKIIRSVNLEHAMTQKPQFIFIKDKYFIAYMNGTFSKLFLTDPDGKILEGFPLDYIGPYTFFDLNKDSEFEIIYGQDNKIFLSTF